MTKFEEQIELLNAANSVANSIQYYVDDRYDSANSYKELAKEKEDKEYWLREASKYETEARIWEQLMTYLEKQYLK